MIASVKAFVVSSLRACLNELPEGNHEIFKLMYGRDNGRRSVEDALAMSINAVIAEIPDHALERALWQAENAVRQYEESPT